MPADPALDLAARERALGCQRQGYDVLDAPARIERGERILEHRLDQPGARLAVEVEQALAVDQHGTRRRLEQSEDHARERGFPAAGLADNAEHAAGRDAEGDIVDRDHALFRRHQPGVDAELAPQVLDLDRGAHAGCSSAQVRREPAKIVVRFARWPARNLARAGLVGVRRSASGTRSRQSLARSPARRPGSSRAACRAAPGPAPARRTTGRAYRGVAARGTIPRSSRARPPRRHTSPTRGRRRARRCRGHG